MSRFHVRKQDGELLSGARAFVEVWRALPGWSWASRLANIPGVLHVMEVAYRISLVVRPVISKLAGRLGFQAANQQPTRPRKADELEN
jgi:predicted DCC family thiol-disulfide oxidoreductase YuxK